MHKENGGDSSGGGIAHSFSMSRCKSQVMAIMWQPYWIMALTILGRFQTWQLRLTAVACSKYVILSEKTVSGQISSNVAFGLQFGVGPCRLWSSLFIQVLEERDKFLPSFFGCQPFTGKLLMLKKPKPTDHRSVWPLYPQPVANSLLIKTDRPQFRGIAGQQHVDWPDRSCKREGEYKTFLLGFVINEHVIWCYVFYYTCQ